MNLKAKVIIDRYLGGFALVLIKIVVVLLGWLLRIDHALPKPRSGQKLTFIKYLGGGSIVMCYPSFLALRRAGFRLRLITSPSVVPFAEELHVFDEICIVDDKSPWKIVRTASRLFFRFRSETCVDLELHSNLSCILTAFYGFRNRMGFYVYDSFWRKGIYTHAIYYNPATNIVLAYERMARLLHAEQIDYAHCKDVFRGAFGSCPDEYSGFVAVAPGCSPLGRERQLTTGEWIKLLSDETRPVAILGGSGDRQAGDAILGQKRGVNLAGKLSLRGSLAVLFSCEKLYCIDSGLLHFARLWSVPTESWWGPTNPAHRISEDALHGGNDIFHYKNFSCSPCVHITAKCPCSGRAECMRAHCATKDANPTWGIGCIEN